MGCANANIRYAKFKDKINILKNLKLSVNDIKEINSLVDNIYEIKNNEIHLVTKRELDKIFPEDLKNKLIEPIAYSPYKRSYIYTILILSNYANKLINNGLDKKSSILKALYSASKWLHYPIIALDTKLPINLFVKKLFDNDSMFCDYLLILKILNKDFEKKETVDLEKLRNDFKGGYEKQK